MSLKVLREMVANFSQPLRAEGCGRAGTLFILTRSLRQKRKACPTRSYPGFISKQEWLERYATPGAEAEFYARLRGGPVAFAAPVSPLSPAAPKPSEAIEPPKNLQ